MMTVVRITLTLGFLAAGGLYIWFRRDEFLTLERPSAFAMTIVGVAYIVNIALRAIYNLITARHLGTTISASESFMLSAVVAAGNFLLPVKAGAGLRALYMKKVRAFPLSFFASSSLIFLLVTTFAVSLIAVILVGLIYVQLGYFRLDLSVLFPAAAVALVLAVVVLRLPGHADGDRSWLGSFRASLYAILGDRSLVLSAIGIALLVFLSSSVAWTVAVREVAPQTASLEAFLLAASQIISGFVTLTPGATGFQEVAGLYVGQSFTASTAEIFAVLVWVRLVRVGVSVLVAVPSALVLRGRLRDAQGNGVPA